MKINLVNKNKAKVLVALSGGVDSAVAAKLLLDEGHQVEGVFLNLWKEQGCTTIKGNPKLTDTMAQASQVADKIGIPFHSLDVEQVFKDVVVDNFLSEYASGRTPNPCIVCNKRIKIGQLIGYAKELGFDYLATGHYLSMVKKDEEYQLFKAKDSAKDQSYFLYTLTQDELAHLLFPLGAYKKSDIKALASQFSLGLDDRPESQDICFLSGSHNDFLKNHLNLTPGPIKLASTRETISEHQGLPLYTIGQRRGIEIGGSGPYYVASLDYDENTLYVVQNIDEAILYKDNLMAHNVSFINGKELKEPLACQAVVRYAHKSEPCLIEPQPKGELRVTFKTPQRAITSGQSVVFYQGDQLLGGGLIK